MQTLAPVMICKNPRWWLFAALLVAAVGVASTPAVAASYLYDDGAIVNGVGVPGYWFANDFTVSGVAQKITAVLIKQPEYPDYVSGTVDAYVWAADGANGMPGTVLGSVLDANIPNGTGFTSVDFSSQNINLAAGAKVYVGYVNGDGTYALYDAAGGAHSWRKTGGVWEQYGTGDFMVRLETYVDPTPTVPGQVSISPTNPTLGDRLKVAAAGSINPDPSNPMSYQYQWAKSTGTAAWGPWTDGTATIAPDQLVAGDRWKVRARAAVTGYQSAWVESTPVYVRNVLFRAIPANGATNVQRQAFLQLNFQWPMVESTIESGFTLTPAGSTTPVTGTFEWKKIGLILRFHPTAPLAQNTVFTLKLPKGIVRRGPLPVQVDTVVTFTTGYMPIPITWLPKGSAVPVTSKIVMTFDKPLDPLSLTADTFKITPAVAGSLSVLDKKVTFTPTKPLAANTNYNVWLSGQVATTTGRIMGRSFAWSFRTAPAAAPALIATANASTTASGATQITVSLTAAANVTVDITNIAGQVIATLPARDLEAGVSTLLWDGRSARGTRAPAGRYFTRLLASSPTGQQVHAQAAFEKQ